MNNRSFGATGASPSRLLSLVFTALVQAIEHPIGQLILYTGVLIWLPANYWPLIGVLILFIVAHEFGHWLVARWFGIDVEVFSIGLPSRRTLHLGTYAGTRFQMTPYWFCGGFVSFDPTAASVLSLAAWKRAAVLLAGVAVNFIVGVAILACSLYWIGRPSFHSEVPVIAQIVPQSPAYKAGLLQGDRIEMVDGRQIVVSADVPSAIAARRDDAVELLIDRGGNAEQLVVTIPSHTDKIGVGLGQMKYTTVGAGAATWSALKESLSFLRDTGTSLLVLMHLPVGVAVPAGGDTVHGIVAVMQMGAYAYSLGASAFLSVCAKLSLYLFLFNLLPIPALDGGHLLFLAIEKLRGRPVEAPTVQRWGLRFLYVLVALGVLGLFNDLAHPFRLP